MSILGEAALSPPTSSTPSSPTRIRKRYVAQGSDENRSIEETWIWAGSC